MTWRQRPTEDFGRRFGRYEKKHRRELEAVLRNLARYMEALNVGANPLQVKFGFIHSEGKGVVAIGENGGGRSLAATRLYVYPDATERVLHLLILGDKRCQTEDIQFCHECVDKLHKRNAGTHEPEQGEQKEGDEPEGVP